MRVTIACLEIEISSFFLELIIPTFAPGTGCRVYDPAYLYETTKSIFSNSF